jgi:hypothetical protein
LWEVDTFSRKWKSYAACAWESDILRQERDILKKAMAIFSHP